MSQLFNEQIIKQLEALETVKDFFESYLIAEEFHNKNAIKKTLDNYESIYELCNAFSIELNHREKEALRNIRTG